MTKLPSPFAADTEVPIDRSQAQIKSLLIAYGAVETGIYESGARHVVAWGMQGMRLRMGFAVPALEAFAVDGRKHARSVPERQVALDKELRRLWRALLLVLKAKLEATRSGIVSFEDEFMPHIILPGGSTMGEQLRPQLAQIAASGKLPPLLEGPGHG